MPDRPPREAAAALIAENSAQPSKPRLYNAIVFLPNPRRVMAICCSAFSYQRFNADDIMRVTASKYLLSACARKPTASFVASFHARYTLRSSERKCRARPLCVCLKTHRTYWTCIFHILKMRSERLPSKCKHAATSARRVSFETFDHSCHLKKMSEVRRPKKWKIARAALLDWIVRFFAKYAQMRTAYAKRPLS